MTFHPVLSNVRDACTCYQPLEVDGPASYKVSMSELPLVTAKSTTFAELGMYISSDIRFDPDYDADAKAAMSDERDSNMVYLYNEDLRAGTLRIERSGTYVLMEDLVVNFNAPSAGEMAAPGFSPNSIDLDELYWFPTRAQSVQGGAYPGLDTFAGPFTLGFFAGIAIETDYVTIDLNGFSLQQHPLFYVQQRFFSLIELASQPFVPGQGLCY